MSIFYVKNPSLSLTLFPSCLIKSEEDLFKTHTVIITPIRVNKKGPSKFNAIILQLSQIYVQAKSKESKVSNR